MLPWHLVVACLSTKLFFMSGRVWRGEQVRMHVRGWGSEGWASEDVKGEWVRERVKGWASEDACKRVREWRVSKWGCEGVSKWGVRGWAEGVRRWEIPSRQCSHHVGYVMLCNVTLLSWLNPACVPSVNRNSIYSYPNKRTLIIHSTWLLSTE